MTPRRAVLRFSLWIVVLLLAGVAVPAAQAQRVDVIPPSGQWVTDRAGLLSTAEAQALTTRLRAYADTTSTQIVVVSLTDLGGADIGLYATELGQQWGVGQQGKDNGVVILVSRDDRKVFIATGFGLEGAIPDAVAARIIRNIITPNFRQGRYYAGLSGAVDALIEAARGEYTADSPPASSERPGDGGVDFATIFVLLIIAYFIVTSIGRGKGGGRRGGGRRYRRHGSPPVIIWGGGGFGGGGGGGFGGFGGFGGGGGGFGGGGAGGSW